MNKTTFFALAAAVLSLAAVSSAYSTTTVLGYDENDRPITGYPFVAFDLGSGGTTALWDGVSSDHHPGYPKFPGNGPWPTPMVPNSGNSSAVLEKVSNGPGGGPYPSGASIYFGGQSYGDIDGGKLRAFDASPVADLSTVIFQIQIGDALAWTFHQDQMPTLSYTTVAGTVANLTADYESLFGFVDSPGFEMFDIGVRAFAFQWDLSEVEDEITSVWVTMNPVQHAQIYGMQLDQGSSVHSDNLLPAAVPEPSAIVLLFGGLLVIAVVRVRKGFRRYAR